MSRRRRLVARLRVYFTCYLYFIEIWARDSAHDEEPQAASLLGACAQDSFERFSVVGSEHGQGDCLPLYTRDLTFVKNQRPHFPFSYVSSFVVKGLNILNAADARHGANLGPRIGNAPRRRRAGAARAGRYNNDLQSSRQSSDTGRTGHSHRR